MPNYCTVHFISNTNHLWNQQVGISKQLHQKSKAEAYFIRKREKNKNVEYLIKFKWLNKYISWLKMHVKDVIIVAVNIKIDIRYCLCIINFYAYTVYIQISTFNSTFKSFPHCHCWYLSCIKRNRSQTWGNKIWKWYTGFILNKTYMFKF